MCDVCGCGGSEHVHRHDDHDHERLHAHGLPHSHAHDGGLRSVRIETDVTTKNDQFAARNRGWFEGRNLTAFNLVSSPGAGKTTLLERTLRDLAAEGPWAVIEGDQQTDNDARRIAACGVPVYQVNTGAVCHLDAKMVFEACRKLNSPSGTTILIENVGNLICPALFDLGEAARVVIASVAEGDDKPEKYPYMFETADLVVLNKCDLLPYVPFDCDRFERSLRQVNPQAPVLHVSAVRGDNLEAWYDWLRTRRAAYAAAVEAPSAD